MYLCIKYLALIATTYVVVVAGLDPISSYGEDCAVNQPCDQDGGMVCLSGSCQCPPGYVVSNDRERCFKERSLEYAFNTIQMYGESCGENERCDEGEGMVCEDNTCVCSPGRVISKNMETCLQEAKRVNDLCEEDVQCIGKLGVHSLCSLGVCRCKQHAILLQDTCTSRAN